MTEALQFKKPEEELAYLRAKVFEAERNMPKGPEARPDRHEVIRGSIQEFKREAGTGAALEAAAEEDALTLKTGPGEAPLEEIVRLTDAKGVLHALKVVEKLEGWHLEDEYHNHLVRLVDQGLPVSGVKEKGPIYRALHMSLFEVVLPKGAGGAGDKPLPELIKGMEQLYAGLLSIAGQGKRDYLAFEVANPDGEEDTRIFVSVPDEHIELFSKQLLSIFPKARLIERDTDYNIFNESGFTMGATAELDSSPAYPLKKIEGFGEDPLNVILNGFSKIPSSGAGAAFQIIFKPVGDKYAQKFGKALKSIESGKSPAEALHKKSLGLELMRGVESMFSSGKKKEEEDHKPKEVDSKAAEAILSKLESPIVETNIRLAVSAPTEEATGRLLSNFQAAFNQFENPGRQMFKWKQAKTSGFLGKDSGFYRAFIFRLFREKEALPLNLRELSGLLHFHTEALADSTRLNRLTSKSAAPSLALGGQGTLLGVNRFQGGEKPVYISDEDRLRHFYTIGQTGTGKSTLLKNMAIEDIKKGEGVCVIDPHGSDIMDILSAVPPERADDVIYFDPSDIEMPMGLNMLEYDRAKPEQKTFVVNELFSIFQKLYGGVPESMGPMFEQYFRNAAMLVIEDPDSGSTLLDVSRVLSNKEYRELKLSHCKNPIVTQFWREVAEKAGGEASLANIVPYITSKFDVFLANDIMRPIVSSERSAFNMRQVMDERKILLVNLSKGRLGDINANLIGLIIVGKILLAALSRADSRGADLPPFYLYIDEFQNVTTDSIATILSEARKYKLSLSVAHQFIAQLEEGIRDAVFGNIGTICAFRVGADDAKYLESQFAPVFTADDLMNIDNRKAHLRMLVNGRPVEPFDIDIPPPTEGDKSVIDRIMSVSRTRYGRPRSEVEEEIQQKYSKKATMPE